MADQSHPTERYTLAVYLFGHNLEKIRYPWRESILSALDLVGPRGAVYFCLTPETDDGTYEALAQHFVQPLATGQLQLLSHEWGTHHTIQAHICNMILDEIGLQYDFALKLDADEVLYGNQWATLQEDMRWMRERGYKLGKPHYTHLVQDDQHEFDFIYRTKAVLMDTRAGYRYRTDQGGDACALAGGLEYPLRLEILHLGKMAMGREEQALAKEREFTKLYEDMGFPDPKVKAQWEQGYLDYFKVFDRAKEAGEIRPFHGPYPVFLGYYLEAARRRSHKFWEARRVALASE